MFINGVKVTLIICLTIVVSCVLFISYTEYINRYSLLTSSDNSIYIFDKKTTVLNRCNDKGCELLETKLPTAVSLNSAMSGVNNNSTFLQGNDKPMVEEVVSPAVKSTGNPIVEAQKVVVETKSTEKEQIKTPTVREVKTETNEKGKVAEQTQDNKETKEVVTPTAS